MVKAMDGDGNEWMVMVNDGDSNGWCRQWQCSSIKSRDGLKQQEGGWMMAILVCTCY